MGESKSMVKAKACLDSVRGKNLSVDERCELAVELAKHMLLEARRTQTSKEHSQQSELAGMMADKKGKAFINDVADQCFRTHQKKRVASQLNFLLNEYGIPKFFSFIKKTKLLAFKYIGSHLPSVVVPLAQHAIRKETNRVILPGERGRLHHILQKRRRQGVKINLNHLGEAILGEQEADNRLQIYLDDLASDEVECISVKISSIFSQINLLAWDDTVEILVSRLRLLFRAARDRKFITADGKKVPKMVNLDMEEYRDLHLTVSAFRKVLDEPEFYHFSAGIVLQAYLPDSYLIQQELTLWAMQRVASGGAPIRLRIVKGANLMMEQFEAAVRGWPQAPYDNKLDVDANYKKMISYALQPDHAQAVNIGIASHNLFDIAYGMLLRAENKVEEYAHFEMLEGMADHMCRVVQKLSGEMLLYCPAATDKEFHTAVAYLVRRLDENTAPENFLHAAFDLIPNTKKWQEQVNRFTNSCELSPKVSFKLRRMQNRLLEVQKPPIDAPFENEPDTDWSLQHNRKWINQIVGQWKVKEYDIIPLVIGGEEILSEITESSRDPSRPDSKHITFSIATEEHAEKALETADKVSNSWAEVSIQKRSQILAEVAHLMRQRRGELIAAMIADGGKTIPEADTEISEAIDFAEYYRKSVEAFDMMEDIDWKPRGVVLVAPPWNFPCAIPAGGVLAALATGNAVIFKPSRETVLVAWELAKIFWDAGVSREVMQFILCPPEPTGSYILNDPRLNAVILTGGTETAKKILAFKPGIHLLAETGGKNAIIATSMADRDLAIANIIQSSFGHSGQKCSACSLLILEAELYDDPHFLKQLKDAARSLKVGSAWDPKTKVNPLVHPPGSKLIGGLTKLDKGERWLLRPKQDPMNPSLWSPGIKVGVVKGSRSHQTEFFGPVLSVMRADDLEHAIKLANGTPYGLTSGLQSLDQREHKIWLEKIRAGNCYINRGITGAIVQRQPFGGCKESSFGPGIKAGGPNYVTELMLAEQVSLPIESAEVNKEVKALKQIAENLLNEEELDVWNASIRHYAHSWINYFSKDHDVTKLQGQDNILRYVPRTRVALRVQKNDKLLDVLRVIAAAFTTKTMLELSLEGEWVKNLKEITASSVNIVEESEHQFMERVKEQKFRRIRLLSEPSTTLLNFLGEQACNLLRNPVLANGRIELLNYLREVSISTDYHRYGNLGIRENEKRKPLPKN